jgi:hypothetical protein
MNLWRVAHHFAGGPAVLGERRRGPVKIVDERGIESLKIVGLD